MRDEPAFVDAVARESATEVIVDSTLANMGERDVHRVFQAFDGIAESPAP